MYNSPMQKNPEPTWWVVLSAIATLIGFIVIAVVLLSILGVMFSFHKVTVLLVGFAVLSIAASTTLVKRRKDRRIPRQP